MESPYIADFERTGPIRKRKLLSTGARRNIHDPIHSPIRSLPRWQERESQTLRVYAGRQFVYAGASDLILRFGAGSGVEPRSIGSGASIHHTSDASSPSLGRKKS